jgi:hypothetical protein
MLLRSILFSLLLLYSQLVHGQSSQEWTEDQRLLAGILATEMLLDWHTTRNLARSNWCYQPATRDHTCWELNPILGQYPSVNRIDNHFLVAGVIIYVLADMLPEYRTQLLSTLVVTEGLAAGNNVIRFGFKW